MTGLLITLEGGEGSGKTTQIQLLEKAFKATGRKCLITREPGGSNEAEAIRQLLLAGSADKWHPVAETLLFQAARVEHVERVILPELAKGAIILCDRFLDSTIVYQGISKGLGADYIKQLHQLTLGTMEADMTFILDIDPKIGLERAKSRMGTETRFENMDIEFHQNVREGFLAIARAEPKRCYVVDANQKPELVHTSILHHLKLTLRL
jgi:dTMP kinase